MDEDPTMLTKNIIKRSRKRTNHSLSGQLHPVLRRVLENRDCQYTDYQLADLLRPDNLKNIDLTTDQLLRYWKNQSKILVIGDYDCDGATATSVAVRGLIELGFASVDFLIPNRFKTGYGLTVEIVKQAIIEKKPDVLLTVDNGISSIDGVDYAISQGLEVVITDHHLPGKTLPNTKMIVNPQLEGDEFESKSIAGVGVIFYVLLALRQKM